LPEFLFHFGGFQAGDFQPDFQTSTVVIDIGPSVINFLPASSRNQCSEGSDYYLTITYYDVFGNPFVPVSAQWSIWDDTNKELLQPFTAYTPSGLTDTIHISDTYNLLGNPANAVEQRQVNFQITASNGSQRNDNAYYAVLAINDYPAA
jgi:hypothetical protein